MRRVWIEGKRAPDDPASAAEHAYQLFRWLQSQPIFAGHVIPSSDIQKVYPKLCSSLGMHPQSWQTVAKFLKLFTGGKRHYRRIGVDNVRVYPIPQPPKRRA